MKEEIEWKWLVNLLTEGTAHMNGFLRKVKPACVKDFERLAGASENNKYFKEWFNTMAKKGVFEFYELRNKYVKTYIINVKLMNKELTEYDIYKKIRRIFQKKAGFFEIMD